MTHKIQPTSLDAYLDILKEMGERQQIVFARLFKLCREYGDATDYEIAKSLNKSDPNFVRPRRNELAKMKKIEVSQKRECRITGRRVLAWRIK